MANKLTQGHIDYLNQGIKATSLNNAFKSAVLEGIDVLDITNLDTSLCTNFEDCFHGFEYNVKADNALDMSSATTCNYMFLGSGVRGLHLKNVPRNLNRSYIGGMEDVVYIIDNYLGYNYDGVYGPIPDEETGFANLYEYSKTYIPNYMTVTNIPKENMEYLNSTKTNNAEFMFTACESLITLDLSNFDTSKITNMRYMFAYCEALTTITGTIDMSSCIEHDRMFYDCPNLKGVHLKNVPHSLNDTWGTEGETYIIDNYID